MTFLYDVVHHVIHLLCQNSHLFLKGVFGMGEEVVFTDCVLKSCVLVNSLFLLCFQQNTAVAKNVC